VSGIDQVEFFHFFLKNSRKRWRRWCKIRRTTWTVILSPWYC